MQEARRPEQAIALAKKAMRLHPNYPPFYLLPLAQGYYQAGRYEESLETWKRLLERTEKSERHLREHALGGLLLVSAELGREKEVRGYARALFDIAPNYSLSGEANVSRFYEERGQLQLLWDKLHGLDLQPRALSTALEYRYSGTPAFVVKRPVGRVKKTRYPIKMLAVDVPWGDFDVFVSDIPAGMGLPDVVSNAFFPVLANEGIRGEVRSNEEITLADGTRAYRTEMDWVHQRKYFVKTIVVSAFKEEKCVFVVAHTVGDPRDVESLLQSLSFTPETDVLTGEIPLDVALHHVHELDNVSSTWMHINIGKDFPGKLPDAIETIEVTGPNGALPIGKDDFRWYPQYNEFWISILGPPDVGTYTVTVSSGNARGTATDTQSVVRTLPLPDTGTFSPGEGETVTVPAPRFSWSAVSAEAPIYYRLRITDLGSNVVHSTEYVEGMLSHNVPEDKLVPGESYFWRVDVSDSPIWNGAQNRANSKWLAFKIAPSPE